MKADFFGRKGYVSSDMIKNKIKHIAETYEVSVEWVWNEFESLGNTQMAEHRKWDYIISLILKMKGYV